MWVHLATFGKASYHEASRQGFFELAALDSIGRHAVVDDPGSADAILFVDLHQHPDDPFLRRRRRNELVVRYPGKTCVFDERDFPTFTFPGVYVGAPARWARSLPVVGGCYPRVLNPLDPDGREPDLLFSFCGNRTHRVREVILGLRHSRGIVESGAVQPFAGDDAEHEYVAAWARYEELIARAKFVLCPRGHGPATYRLFEVMRAGRVPVIISDAWLPPQGVDWDACSVRISECHAKDAPRILEEREADWERLLSGARTAARRFAPDRLWDHIASSVELARGRDRHRCWSPAAEAQVARLALRELRRRLQRD